MSFGSPSPAFITCPKCHASVQSPGIGKVCECGNCACQLFIDKNGNPVDLAQTDLHAPTHPESEAAPQPQTIASPEQTAISLPSSTSSEEMAFGYCPSCHASFYVPANSRTFKCGHCGQEMRLGKTEASGGRGSGAEYERQAQPVPTGCAALDSWKTSVLFSILGLVLSVVWMGVMGYIIAIVISLSLPSLPTQYVFSFAAPINGLIYQLACLVYAIAFYPSYFKEKPLIKSRRTISCLNFLFGGVIFGSLWNHNLTRKEKGISYVVCTILAALAFCSISFQLLVQAPQYAELNNQLSVAATSSTAMTNSDNTVSSNEASEDSGSVASYVNEEVGFSVEFPSDPQVAIDDQSEVNSARFLVDLGESSEGVALYDFVQADYATVPLCETEEEENDFLNALLTEKCEGFWDLQPDADFIRYFDVQGSPAISYGFTARDCYANVEVVHDEDQIFYIVAVGETMDEVERFCSSFRLV